jgi:hypothetical protein
MPDREMYLRVSKSNGLLRIAKFSYGYQCLTEIELSFDKLLYLETVNYKHKYIL